MNTTLIGALCPDGDMVPVKGVTMNAVKLLQKESQLELQLFFPEDIPKTA